jgi:hypothetical protein
MRTPKEIQTEIAALEACKAYAPHHNVFGDDNHRKIDLQIEYLKDEIDTTADDEWEQYNYDEQSAIMEAQSWMECDSDESPSSGWDNYKPKPKSKSKK